MNRWATGALGACAVVAALAAWAISGPRHEPSPRPQAERPPLALLTSLPLIFGESFGLENGGSAALSSLDERYRVQPIGVADAASLKSMRLLLMAHPRAQPAEALVDLDAWVRGGGRLLLLADPKLDWPSERPMGDRLRPPPAFADTGLLAHWGLRLNAPEQSGPARLGGGHNPIIYFSAGRLASTNPDCALSRANIVAECTIGKGRVTVVADADFLNTDELKRYGGIPKNQTSELLELLGALESR
ncbi:MAG TPA: DUF4350 domain-containing protein [Sphingomicrobium sp.]|nr:DUF4350 domain-containing protein [Sphingomicrobium sp.]